MRSFAMSLAALSLAIPAAVTLPAGKAEARHHYYHHYYRGANYAYRGRRCTHSGGTTGAVVGGTAGALAGNGILGHGALGTVAGGVGGFFAGRAIDRTITAHRRCR